MGFLDSSPHSHMLVFYNVNMCVGKNGANRRDDVILVQYMLKHCFEVASAHIVRPAGKQIEVTGVYDFPTEYGILWYQGQISMIDKTLLTMDGRIDRILNKTNFKGSVTGEHYTLFWLNRNLREMNQKAWFALRSHVPLHKMNIVPG